MTVSMRVQRTALTYSTRAAHTWQIVSCSPRHAAPIDRHLVHQCADGCLNRGAPSIEGHFLCWFVWGQAESCLGCLGEHQGVWVSKGDVHVGGVDQVCVIHLQITPHSLQIGIGVTLSAGGHGRLLMKAVATNTHTGSICAVLTMVRMNIRQ